MRQQHLARHWISTDIDDLIQAEKPVTAARHRTGTTGSRPTTDCSGKGTRRTSGSRKSGFLANMSHELRTLLNAIMGSPDTLLMKLPGPRTSDQEEQLTLPNKCRHLLSLINDLLDLAKLNPGKSHYILNPSPV